MGSKKSNDVLYFGQFEVVDKKTENVIVEIDYQNNTLSIYLSAVKFASISFSEFCTVQTDGELMTLLKHTNSNYESLFSFASFNKQECVNLFQLLDNIIENKNELSNKDSTLIRNLCESMKDKICLRYQVVHQKYFKLNTKNMIKKPPKTAAAKKNIIEKPKSNASISFLLLTESHLYCFENESKTLPLHSFPLSDIIWKKTSDDIKFTCNGTSAAFQISDIEQRFLFQEAIDFIPRINEDQVIEIERVIKQIRDYFATTFDKVNKQHINYLRRLWEASQLNIENDKNFEFEIQCERWKDLGFQRDDPVSDFRATGIIGLQNLIYFAETHSGMFLHISRNQQQSTDMTEYPFATAGINITYLLIQLLKLKKEEDWFPNMQTFPLFFHSIRAWEELYTIIFRLFDQKWNQMNVGYMGFQKVIDATKEGVEELLTRRSTVGVPAIFDMLGILLEDLKTFRTAGVSNNAPKITTSANIKNDNENKDNIENNNNNNNINNNVKVEATVEKKVIISVDAKKEDEKKDNSLRNSDNAEENTSDIIIKEVDLSDSGEIDEKDDINDRRPRKGRRERRRSRKNDCENFIDSNDKNSDDNTQDENKNNAENKSHNGENENNNNNYNSPKKTRKKKREDETDENEDSEVEGKNGRKRERKVVAPTAGDQKTNFARTLRSSGSTHSLYQANKKPNNNAVKRPSSSCHSNNELSRSVVIVKRKKSRKNSGDNGKNDADISKEDELKFEEWKKAHAGLSELEEKEEKEVKTSTLGTIRKSFKRLSLRFQS